GAAPRGQSGDPRQRPPPPRTPAVPRVGLCTSIDLRRIEHYNRRIRVKPKDLLSWSSGKDCAWALHLLRQQGQVEVVGLVTTFNEAFGRVAMHGVRIELA